MDQGSDAHATLGDIRQRINLLLDDLIAHDGFGELQVKTRWVKRDLKEVLITSGKEYRYVIKVSSPQSG